MKQRLLLLERLKRAALLVLLLYAVGMSESLAQTQVATLQHGDSIRVFYGANALTAAYNAADTCDIITLSDGTFTGVNITKAITLRGAGCVWDSVSASFPTVVSGNMSLRVLSEESSLTIEGIHFSGCLTCKTLNSPRFFHCNFDELNCSSGSSEAMNQAQFVNCMFKKASLGGAYDNSVINCVIWNLSNSNTMNVYNSIIRITSNPTNMSAYNSIITNMGNGGSICCLQGNSVAYNCIGINTSTSLAIFRGQNYGCMTVESYADVFETFDGSGFSYLEKFLLKEEIASGFLGTDGTEVGIYGGTASYNPRPSHMVVKHCNVANKSTIDGKLSVEIEVYTEDE